MNFQEIFNKVVTHLRAQNCKSYLNYKGCRYRGPNGTMCAVGCLIPNDIYSTAMEGGIISHIIGHFDFPLWMRDEETLGFLMELQNIHDNFAVENWESQFQSIATNHGLTLPSVVGTTT